MTMKPRVSITQNTEVDNVFGHAVEYLSQYVVNKSILDVNFALSNYQYLIDKY